MKVFLANAPWCKPGYYGVRAGSRWPHFERTGSCYIPFPFFLAYAAAILERNGHEVILVDAIAEALPLDAFYERLQKAAPDVVVYEVSTPSIDADLKIAHETRLRLGDVTPVVFCGPHHEMYLPDFLKSHVDLDFIIKGEYELALLELVTSLAARISPVGLPGTISRAPGGDIIVGADRPLEDDLQRFPWPARHLLPMTQYADLTELLPSPSLQLWGSRGCPYRCIFCSWPQIMYGGSSYRTRDPKDVVDELVHSVKSFGFKSFYFDDDTFNIGKERMIILCDEVAGRGVNLPWAIMARADCMDREILTAMKKAGLVAVKYGVESSSPAILKASGKALDIDRVRETIRLTRELGISYHLTFTFGLPGETMETIAQTVAFAIEMDPDSLQFSIVTPFPGSAYYSDLEEKGYLVSRNWDEYDGYNRAVIRTDNLSAASLESSLRKANRRWKRHVFLRMLRSQPLDTLMMLCSSPLKMLSTYRG